MMYVVKGLLNRSLKYGVLAPATSDSTFGHWELYGYESGTRPLTPAQNQTLITREPKARI